MKIHNVFYILLLKLYNRVYKGNVLPLIPININSKNEYKVEKILNSKNYYNKLQQLFKDNITRFKNLIELFHKLYLKKPKVGKREKTAK